MSTWFTILSLFSIIAFALVGGVFLAFSDFIMRSLGKAGGPDAIAIMQSINREVFRYVFMPMFTGMALVSLVVIGYASINLSGLAAVLTGSAGGLYLIGVFVVTVAFNVPLNNYLANMDFSSDAALDFWRTRYLPDWTFWNSVRAIASVLAAALYLFAVVWLV